MFRREGAGESYMYYPNMQDAGTCGKEFPFAASFSFVAGTWHDVKLYIKLNTGGAYATARGSWLCSSALYHLDMQYKASSLELVPGRWLVCN